MKNFLIIILLLAVWPATAQYNKENLKLEAAMARNGYGNLVLYPVRANQAFHTAHKSIKSYTTLDEALRKKKLRITESSQDGSVNTLFVENISRDTIMILAGEVVQGGKQDRMIARDFILYPNSGKKDLDVFCVEHGRWDEKSDGISFKSQAPVNSNEVRKAATVGKSQQEVWDKVAETTSKNNASTNTGTLTALNSSGDFAAKLDKYSSQLASLFSDQPDVIGVVAVSGDHVLGCDMFATHAIFEQHFPQLVKGYATEAITSGQPVTISYDSVNRYLLEIIGDESKQERNIQKKGAILKEKDAKIHISTF